MFKLETTHFHRRVRGSNLHCGIFARRGNVETHLCDRKKPRSTYQTHDESEVRTSSCSLRSSSQEANFEKTSCQNWQNLSLDQFINSHAVVTASSQEKQIFVANRAAEKLENSSMDQCRHVKGVENPADIGTTWMPIEGLKESVWLNGLARLQSAEEKWSKPWCQVNEFEAEQATSTVAIETEPDRLINWRQ